MTKVRSVVNFEDTLTRIEAIVAQLEAQSLPLEESLKLYQEGVKLVRSCQKTLQEAEQKVTLLSQNGESAIKEDLVEA